MSKNCPRCEKQVYFNEQIIGPQSTTYHKSCFTCVECNRRLDSTTLSEHENLIYCKTCHSKLFGPKGYGYGGGAGILSTGVGPLADKTATSDLEVTQETILQSKLRTSAQNLAGSQQTSAKTNSSGNFVSSAGNLATSSDVCPVCSQKVYFAEQVLGPGSNKYHKACFRCAECKKSLDSTSLTYVIFLIRISSLAKLNKLL